MRETNQDPFQFVFGPVPSRRLGRSLGVDTVPYKTCTYDCVYCQLGPTTAKTMRREAFVPVETLLGEVRRRLKQRPGVDCITLSGSGEPTLYSELEPLIRGIRKQTNIPVAVLTNGSLLWDGQVRRAIGRADLVIPSLDAGNSRDFLRVNRPVEGIGFDAMVDGLRRFREFYRGRLWLEVFLLEGLTANQESVRAMAALARAIGPDKVQLNTVARPPVEACALAVPRARMLELAGLFAGGAEVIAEYAPPACGADSAGSQGDVLGLLRRRPCTLEGVAAGLAMHRNEAVKHLEHLAADGLVTIQENEGGIFYVAKDPAPDEAGGRPGKGERGL